MANDQHAFIEILKFSDQIVLLVYNNNGEDSHRYPVLLGLKTRNIYVPTPTSKEVGGHRNKADIMFLVWILLV